MLLLQLMAWLTENQIVQDRRVADFLANLPLGWMWSIVGAFTFGLVVQDAYNPSSWLRQHVANFKRVIKVEWAGFPHRSTPQVEWTEFKVKVRFLRAARADLSVRVVYHAGGKRYALILRDHPDLGLRARATDEQVDMVLATFPIKAYDGKGAGYNAWGIELVRNHEPGLPFVPVAGEAVVEIAAKTWRGVQTERILLALPHVDTGSFGKIALLDGNHITIHAPEEPN